MLKVERGRRKQASGRFTYRKSKKYFNKEIRRKKLKPSNGRQPLAMRLASKITLKVKKAKKKTTK